MKAVCKQSADCEGWDDSCRAELVKQDGRHRRHAVERKDTTDEWAEGGVDGKECREGRMNEIVYIRLDIVIPQ